MNRSTLLKLGALGTALYFANKNKNAQAKANDQKLEKRQQQLGTNQEKLDRQKQ